MSRKYPKWVDYFVKLARPGSMVAMFSLLVGGGILFAFVEAFSAGTGARMAGVFVSFLNAIGDEYYETLRFMFGAYVLGRSSQEIAKTVRRES